MHEEPARSSRPPEDAAERSLELGATEQERRQRRLWFLQYGSQADFADPSLEYRRIFAEIFGTFLLVLVAAGGEMLHAQGKISLSAAVVAPGLMVMGIILFMGAVAGAHLNPAVSIAFALRRDFPWLRVPGYVLAQLVGATLAALALRAILGDVGGLGVTRPGPGYSAGQAFWIETLLTLGLVSVILGTASGAQNVGGLGAIAVGGYIALAGLWAAPISGASMNPARSIGPALVAGSADRLWIYIAGPVLGALAAVGCAFLLRGAGGDPISRGVGSGLLGPGTAQERARLAHEIEAGEMPPPGLGRDAN